MPLSIKDATEIIVIVPNRFKGLPSERQIRIEENGCPRIILSVVHIILELNELFNARYPDLRSDGTTYKSSSSSKQKKEGHLSSSDGDGVQREGVFLFLLFFKTSK